MPHDGDDAAYDQEGRGFYGAVTVSERGQIVIPAKARRDLGIAASDKLLVFGDAKQGLALMKIEFLMPTPQDSASLFEQIQRHARESTEQPEPGGNE